jgi:hypothetical protein
MFEHPAIIVLLALAGFAVIFPLFWMAVVVLISRLSGWAGLAQRFAVSPEREVTGDRFAWSSAQFGLLGSYSNCIDIVVSRNGLYMRPMVLFRTGHEPLLIPWNQIEDVSSINRVMFTANKVTIKPARPGGWPTTLTLFGKRIGESLNRCRAID